jgi:adenylate cyclase
MDFAAAGLLDGLEGEERAARQRLLEQLADAGFTQAELQDAVAEDRLALLPVDRALAGQHTAEEIEERTGVPAGLVLRVRRLLGLPEARPDDRVFRDEDIDAAESAKLFLEAGVGEDGIAEVTRVLGEGMARLAATTAGAFVGAFLKAGDTEQDIAARFPELAERLSEALGPVLSSAYKAHLRERVRRGMIGRVEREHGSVAGAQEMTICFADLVGFTRLGGEAEATELGSVAGKLAELAAEVAERPVRLVKTIGDAAMFVSQEPGPMIAAALDLVDAIEEHGLPSVRAGIACGKALERAGDFYGHPVNLASRVTGVARPSSVLCTKEVREAAPEDFDWSAAGKHRLKGVEGSVPLFRARRLSTAEQDGDDAGASKKRKADRRRRRASN